MGFGQGFTPPPGVPGVAELEADANVAAPVEVIVPEFLLLERSPGPSAFHAADFPEVIIGLGNVEVVQLQPDLVDRTPAPVVDTGADEEQEMAVTPGTEVVEV